MPIILHSIFVAYNTHLQKHPIVQAISVLSFGRLARMTCPHRNLDITKTIQKGRTKPTNLGHFEYFEGSIILNPTVYLIQNHGLPIL